MLISTVEDCFKFSLEFVAYIRSRIFYFMYVPFITFIVYSHMHVLYL